MKNLLFLDKNHHRSSSLSFPASKSLLISRSKSSLFLQEKLQILHENPLIINTPKSSSFIEENSKHFLDFADKSEEKTIEKPDSDQKVEKFIEENGENPNKKAEKFIEEIGENPDQKAEKVIEEIGENPIEKAEKFIEEIVENPDEKTEKFIEEIVENPVEKAEKLIENSIIFRNSTEKHDEINSNDLEINYSTIDRNSLVISSENNENPKVLSQITNNL